MACIFFFEKLLENHFILKVIRSSKIKRNIMNRFKTIALMYLMISILTISCGKKEVPVAEPEEQFIFKVQFVLGDVKIRTAGLEKAANQGDSLAVNDVITTGKKAVADLLYGKSGVVRISENSNLVVSSIADKSNNDTIMTMDNGKVLCTLAKLKGTGFKVKTPTVVASIRGTSFTVLSDKKGVKLSVVKGTVAVNPVKEGKIIDEKSIDVEAGKRTDYIDKKAVDKIIMGKMEIPVMEMTPAEKIEIQSEVKEIKVEEIPELALELNEVSKQEAVTEPAVEEKKEVKIDDSAAKKAQEAALAKKRAEEEKLKAEELKRQQEEELARQAEEKKKKEEQQKKERASNIPTM